MARKLAPAIRGSAADRRGTGVPPSRRRFGFAGLLVRTLPLLLLAIGSGCTAHRPGEGDEALRVLVISDLNGPYGSTSYSPTVTGAIHNALRDLAPDVVLVPGDLVAGQSPQLSDARVREMWAAFDSAVAAPIRAAGVPLVIALGNHDASGYPAHDRDRRLAREYWDARGSGDLPLADAAGFPLRYTVRFRDVFIAVWDATRQESGSDEELLAWLREALQSPAASGAAHRLVVGHLPLYPIAEGRERRGEFLLNGDSLRRELERLGATVFVSGHHHAFYAGKRGALSMLYSGALGSGPRKLLGGHTAPRNALALLELRPDSIAIEGYHVGEAGELRPISLHELPPAICSSAGMVLRIDVDRSSGRCDEPSP